MTAARVRVTQNQPGRWVCKGPQGHVGRARSRWEAMVAYARRRVAGTQEPGEYAQD